MLVLTRKIDEAIQIGDNIRIKVSEISGNRVKICIEAPKEVRILRAEIQESVEAQDSTENSSPEKSVKRNDDSLQNAPLSRRRGRSSRVTSAAK